MRAIVREQFGGPEQLVIQEIPEPEPLPDHVVIEVKECASFIPAASMRCWNSSVTPRFSIP
jgi:NADPH:quinone reductase-like Zn-dependent oxidoreductase